MFNQCYHLSGISGTLEKSGNSAKVMKKSVKGRGICVVGEICLWELKKITAVLYSYCNSFFIRDVHREFGVINVHSFDILPAISPGKVWDFFLSGEW